ncbi:MAG: hypothetical protein KA956_07870 [Pyrinomonadaceae bacterium]|nr:hypothetical protein [Pyrinomonadaceae bacterium]
MPQETYGLYKEQLEAGIVRFIGNSEVDHPAFKNYVNFTYNPKVSVRFQNMNERFWRVTGIKVKDQKRLEDAVVSIFFSYGLICGYSYDTNREFSPDAATIDVSSVTREFLDSPDTVVRTLLSDDDQRLINWSDVFEVEVNGKEFFHLRDIGDGDFIGIDGDGLIYEIHHDPLEVIGVEGNLGEVFARFSERMN